MLCDPKWTKNFIYIFVVRSEHLYERRILPVLYVYISYRVCIAIEQQFTATNINYRRAQSLKQLTRFQCLSPFIHSHLLTFSLLYYHLHTIVIVPFVNGRIVYGNKRMVLNYSNEPIYHTNRHGIEWAAFFLVYYAGKHTSDLHALKRPKSNMSNFRAQSLWAPISAATIVVHVSNCERCTSHMRCTIETDRQSTHKKLHTTFDRLSC